MILRTPAATSSWLTLRSPIGCSWMKMCEWLTRSKMVGMACATPGTASSCGVSSSTTFSMPFSDVPSGVSMTSWNSPMSSFGRNDRPIMRLRTKLDANTRTLTATMTPR